MKAIAYREMYENEISHAWYIATRNLMIKNLKKYLDNNAKILDVGCGTGGTIKFLNKSGFKNVSGVEINKNALNYCKKRGIKTVKKGDVNNLNYKSGSYDAVICLDVLYHRGVDKEKALNSFYHLLKKGGILYLQEPAYNWLKSKHDIAIETNNRFTIGQIKSSTKKAGFKIIKLSYFNALLSPLIIVKRIIDKIIQGDRKTSDVNKLNKLENMLMLKTLHLEINIFNKVNIPFGVSIVCIAKK